MRESGDELREREEGERESDEEEEEREEGERERGEREREREEEIGNSVTEGMREFVLQLKNEQRARKTLYLALRSETDKVTQFQKEVFFLFSLLFSLFSLLFSLLSSLLSVL